MASGDLPAAIVILEGISDCTGATDEARALAEVVHDVAPGAAIAAHTSEGGQANFAQGIVDLANFGAKVITDDVQYFAEPMFQDGIIAQAVDLVKARGGVSYFSAAGNDGRRSYESPFRPSGIGFDVGFGFQEAHDFDPGPGIDVGQQITIPTGEGLNLVFQWDQPFFSVSGAPGSQIDMDILLVNAACSEFLNESFNGDREGFDDNLGRDPFEFVVFTNTGPATTFGVIILKFRGPDPGLMKTRV